MSESGSAATEAATEAMAAPEDAERALAEARATGDPRTIGGAESYLGASYVAHGRRADALAALQASEQTFAAAGLQREAAISRINVARCLSESGRGAEALELYEGVAAARESTDRDIAVEAWNGLVEHHQQAGELSRATVLIQDSVRRLEAEGRWAVAADALMIEGAAHHRAGELHQAVDCFTRAVAAYDAAGEGQWAANARHNLGVVKGP